MTWIHVAGVQVILFRYLVLYYDKNTNVVLAQNFRVIPTMLI